jgi:RHS repeat-associated protein
VVGERGSSTSPMRLLALSLAFVLTACSSTPVVPTSTPAQRTTGPTPSVGPISTVSPSTTSVAPTETTGAATPTPVQSTPEPSHPPVVKTPGPLALEACDPDDLIPCEQQAIVLQVPIAGTGILLTWSSEWGEGRLDRPDWFAGSLGLGGWSLNILDRYDTANHILVAGDGAWRFVDAIALPSGELVVPSRDGRRASVFDAAGRHLRIVDARLGIVLVRFTYDGSGALAGSTGSLDGKLATVTVEHPNAGTRRLLAAGGSATDVVVAGNGHLVSITDPSGGASNLGYDASLTVNAFRDASGAVTSYTWDDRGRLASTTDADGVVTRYERDQSEGTVEIRRISANGVLSTYRSRVASGSLERRFTSSAGVTSTLIADPSGERTLALGPSAVATSFSIGAQPDPRWGLSAPLLTPIVTRWANGRWRTTQVIQEVALGEDLLHPTDWLRTTTVEGESWTEEAGLVARTIATADPDGRRTVWAVDEAGRLTRLTEPGQPTRSWTYDAVGRLASSAVGLGDVALRTTYAYDPRTGTASITRSDGRARRISVDERGNTVRVVPGDGSALQMRYDPVDRLTQVRPPGRPSTTLGYSRSGRPTAYVPPIPDVGAVEQRSYDKDGLLVRIEGPGARTIMVRRDDSGRPSSWTTDRGQTVLSYDAGGLLNRLRAPDNVETTLTNLDGRPTALAWAGPLVQGIVSVERDDLGRISDEIVQGVPISIGRDRTNRLVSLAQLSFQRDPVSGLATSANLGSLAMSWQYDANSRLEQAATFTTDPAAGDGVLALSLRYERDELGRIVGVTETRGDGTILATQYEYDDQDRLARILVDGAVVESEIYDGVGNRVSVAHTDGTTSATYDDADRLLEWGKARFEYQLDGTLARRIDGSAVTTYDYDDLGALRGVVLPDGRRIGYVVDGLGLRIGRIVDGKLAAGYLYGPDGQIRAELTPSGETLARFAYDDRGHLAYMVRNARNYLVVTDHLGSPRLVVDQENGKVAQAVTYDAWGKVTSDSKPGFTPFGFAGGLRDLDTEFVRFGARDYDPSIGRWTGPDPIRFAGGDINFYRYSAGDPVNRVDPSGLVVVFDDLAWLLFIGIVLGAMLLSFELGIVAGAVVQDQHPELDPMLGLRAPDDPAPDAPAPDDPAPDDPGDGGGLQCIGPCAPPPGDECVGNCSSGDPHLVSADGRRFDFQAAGEFIAAQSTDGSVVIQVRQEPPVGLNSVTINTALAASVAGDRIGIYTGNDRRLTINGEAQPLSDFVFRLGHGGILERHGYSITIDWPAGSRLSVTAGVNRIDYVFEPDPEVGPTLIGILGNRDGDPSNDVMVRDGAAVDPSSAELYTAFANSWRISQAESLFDYADGEGTATFTDKSIPNAGDPLANIGQEKRDQAAAVCQAAGVTDDVSLAACILDVAATGDATYAGSAVAAQPTTVDRARTGGPVSSIPIVLGQRTAGFIGPNGTHDYRFDARAGDVVYLDAQADCVTGLGWQLLNPAGKQVSVQRMCVDMGRYDLTADGTWTIHISSQATAGDYAFTVFAAPPTRVASIEVGDQVSDRISRVGELHLYELLAQAGQVVIFDAKGECVTGLSWLLLDPSGRSKAVQRSCTDLGGITLDAAGTWTIEITAGNTTAIGPYAFALGSPR